MFSASTLSSSKTRETPVRNRCSDTRLVKGINKELLKATKSRDSKSSLKKFEQAAAKCHVNGFVSVTLKEKT